MCNDSCPNCRTRSGINKYKVLLISFENLPLAFLVGIVVLAFGEKFGYSGLSTTLFACLAIAPHIMSFDSKMGCENCGVDFRESKKIAVKASDH